MACCLRVTRWISTGVEAEHLHVVRAPRTSSEQSAARVATAAATAVRRGIVLAVSFMSTTRPQRDVKIVNPTGVGVVRGQDDADGRVAAEGARVAAWVDLDPEVRLADPQPRDLENPDVALEALRLDGAEGGLVESTALPASATDSHGASLADQVMASVSR
jgi:acyl-CoA synthetase (NDP forming)